MRGDRALRGGAERGRGAAVGTGQPPRGPATRVAASPGRPEGAAGDRGRGLGHCWGSARFVPARPRRAAPHKLGAGHRP